MLYNIFLSLILHANTCFNLGYNGYFIIFYYFSLNQPHKFDPSLADLEAGVDVVSKPLPQVEAMSSSRVLCLYIPAGESSVSILLWKRHTEHILC